MQNLSVLFIKSFFRFMNVSPIYINGNFEMSILYILASVLLLLLFRLMLIIFLIVLWILYQGWTSFGGFFFSVSFYEVGSWDYVYLCYGHRNYYYYL